MNKMKKIVALVICLVMGTVFATSCSMISVNEDKDRAQVVAEVNGAPITKGEVLDQTDMALQQTYQTTREQFVASYGEDTFTNMKKQVLESAIGNELLYQKAKEEGLVKDSDEDKETKRQEIMETLDSLKKSVEDTVNGDDTITDKETAIEEDYQRLVKLYGYEDIDKVIEAVIKNDAINAEVEKLNAEVSYSEEDAKKEYDSLLATQQAEIEADATKYNTYKSEGAVVYEPTGAKYVKHILIPIPDEAKTEISSLRSNGDDAGADALLKTELEKIKADADKALERAKAGEDFNALIEELGSDPGMQQEPAKTEGYMVYKGSGMVEPFETATLAMTTPGEISELVASDFGYHILQYVSEGGGAIPFEKVKESITSTKLSEAQKTFISEKIEEWRGVADIKTYPDRLSTFA